MSYHLATSYAGQGLISGFDFVSISDPANGFVSYQNLPSALSYGYATVDPLTNAVKLQADSINSYDPDGSFGGRPSLRIESKQPVNMGLVIGDFAHMPGSVCGTWPAFWMYGPNWPGGGEIDIIEGANMAYRNLISAHTGELCSLPTSGLYTGAQQFKNCTDDDDAGQYGGCNYTPPTADTSSYGDAFNAVGGGVYAMDWTSEAIRIWHFPRNKIPANIVSKQPDPSTWGAPQALIGGSSDTASCDIGASFSNMTIVLNIDFCGDYAGGSNWGSSACRTYASSCEIWVGNSPSKFVNSYWEVNYIDVYSLGAALPSSSISGPSASQPLPSASGVVSDANPPGPSGSAGSIDTPPVPSASGVVSDANPPGPSGSTASGAPSIATPPVPPPSGPASSAGASASLPGRPPVLSSPGSFSSITPISSSPSPAGSTVPDRDPATVGQFALLGCFASTTSFSTFSLSGATELMTPEVCASLCSARTYAGVRERTCYCADGLDAGTSALPDNSRCNIPCPGNPAESCGGNNNIARRDAPSSFLLTMYINLAGPPALNPPPAPALGGPSPDNYAITTTVTYTTVCSTNPALLVTLEYCTTLTATKCARCVAGESPQPTVPVTAIEQTCNKCGAKGESTVTLTIPVGALSGPGSAGNSDQQPAPVSPAPGLPAGTGPVPEVGGASSNGNGNGNANPAAQPGAKVSNATVPAATKQVGSTATIGLVPVQAGAISNRGLSGSVIFAVVVAALML